MIDLDDETIKPKEIDYYQNLIQDKRGKIYYIIWNQDTIKWFTTWYQRG